MTGATQKVMQAASERDDNAPSTLDVHIGEHRYHGRQGIGQVVLGDVEFSLRPGTFNCLIGPSGCGKTTTLRLIMGLEELRQGHIVRRDDGPMAVVFQEPRLLPWRSVEDNIRIVHDSPLPEPQLDDLLEALGLSQHREHFPGQLSLGLARRVALARAFSLKPTLLLLDEPFVSLDEPTAERLRSLLLDLWKRYRTTVFMVTHNLREAIQLADRILVMSAGPGRITDSFTIETAREQRDESVFADWQQRLSETGSNPASS